jgi:hypothetical protein
MVVGHDGTWALVLDGEDGDPYEGGKALDAGQVESGTTEDAMRFVESVLRDLLAGATADLSDADPNAMTDEQLTEIERVWDAATPGPWLYDPRHDEIGKPNPKDKHDSVVQGGYEAGEIYMSEADGTAIALAPTHVRALIAEVKRLRALAAKHVDAQDHER